MGLVKGDNYLDKHRERNEMWRYFRFQIKSYQGRYWSKYCDRGIQLTPVTTKYSNIMIFVPSHV